jgi:EcsC protein family
MSAELSDYERAQVAAIEAWRAAAPSLAGQTLVRLLSPAVFLVDKMIPPGAFERAIEGARWTAQRLTDQRDVLARAGVSTLIELRTVSALETCDALSLSVQRWSLAYAAGEGALAGAAGAWGMAVDIPAAITLAYRTIYKTGVCYGYAPAEVEESVVHGILAASGANTMQEKVAALACLSAIRSALHQQSWTMLANKAAEHAFSREGAIIAVRSLARQLGINLTKRKALQAIPVIGAAVGGSVNAWYMRDVTMAARHAFQARWLAERGKAFIAPE